MSNIIQGIKVGSSTYKYDYNSLENLPARELPSSTQNDSGKTLTVNSSGNPAWKTPASGLPSSTAGDNGKVLAVNSMGNPAWATPQSELPSYSQNDSGKALFVNTTGHLTWSHAEEALPVIGTDDEGKVLIVNNNSAEWGEVIPAHDSACKGDVLTIGGCGDSKVIWGSPFPNYDPTYDIGKVLTITENGPEWVMPS